MTDEHRGASTRTTRRIDAPRKAVYRAFTDPDLLAAWRAPENMTATVCDFDLRVGGGYRMSLFYSVPDPNYPGKTAEGEDSYSSRFVELDAPAWIVEAITFDSDDPALAGEMIMAVTLDELDSRTAVTIGFDNLPPAIRPEDNDAGTRSSLEKLARLVETD